MSVATGLTLSSLRNIHNEADILRAYVFHQANSQKHEEAETNVLV